QPFSSLLQDHNNNNFGSVDPQLYNFTTTDTPLPNQSSSLSTIPPLPVQPFLSLLQDHNNNNFGSVDPQLYNFTTTDVPTTITFSPIQSSPLSPSQFSSLSQGYNNSHSDNDINYAATELECLGIIWAIKHFHSYLSGSKFKLNMHH
ncbi:7717_t:CDS:1, partial [Entrophospora sp. SA101]